MVWHIQAGLKAGSNRLAARITGAADTVEVCHRLRPNRPPSLAGKTALHEITIQWNKYFNENAVCGCHTGLNNKLSLLNNV